jgi:isopenicillin N synthase-like dioxygenase
VKNVPGFVEKRQALLPLALEFAKLPEEKKKQYEDAASNYSFGWSHGKEILQDGKADIYKGSYYANPQYNRPTEDPKVCILLGGGGVSGIRPLILLLLCLQLIKDYPEYCAPNVWPTAEIPQLEEAFMNLGRLIVEVGVKVAKHCDQYGEKKTPRRLS